MLLQKSLSQVRWFLARMDLDEEIGHFFTFI